MTKAKMIKKKKQKQKQKDLKRNGSAEFWRDCAFFSDLIWPFSWNRKKPLRFSNLRELPYNDNSYGHSNLFDLCKPICFMIINNWMMLIFITLLRSYYAVLGNNCVTTEYLWAGFVVWELRIKNVLNAFGSIH